MARMRQAVVKGLRAVDRALGGQQHPTRLQRWGARHPLLVALCAGLPFTLFFMALSQADEIPNNLFLSLGAGLVMGSVFGLTALSERHRQNRLRSIGGQRG
ncbi:hypothetical protein [Streptomyces sp. NPDC048392]|uniref:hypothetical protein n=1 Tax=Streptomyces sp. NPDC048392 TaxID=3365543 RepID=UPI00371E4188